MRIKQRPGKGFSRKSFALFSIPSQEKKKQKRKKKVYKSLDNIVIDIRKRWN